CPSHTALCPPALPALANYTVLALGLRAGLPCACLLSSGILVLLITVTHTLLQAWRLSRRSYRSMYDSDSAQPSDVHKDVASLRPRPEIHRKFSFPEGSGGRDRDGHGSDGHGSDRPRMHRALSVESALLQAQGKAWNVITQEMGTVMARKPAASAKDSTLV
ncbi:TM221 protein, partial [Sakesphorus luctuosus]|nr:TM221 protein [Sakesphorus luctuosus]